MAAIRGFNLAVHVMPQNLSLVVYVSAGGEDLHRKCSPGAHRPSQIREYAMNILVVIFPPEMAMERERDIVVILL